MTSKKTMVLGASTHSWRFSFKAANKLITYGHEIVPIGNKEGTILNNDIVIGHPSIEGVHTVTVYLHPKNQVEYYEYILEQIQPERIIFNPGSENSEWIEMAEKKQIEVVKGCTLVMLSADEY